MNPMTHIFTKVLFCCISITFTSCEVFSPPQDIEWVNNPYDGRDPDVIPMVISLTTMTGNGFTNSTNAMIKVSTKAAYQILIGEVSVEGSEINANWQKVDSTLRVQLFTGDGEKWIGCQAKALNNNLSDILYSNIKLDTQVSIISFNWSSTGGDTVVPDDRIIFTLETSDDSFGPETGGLAVVTVEGWDGIDLLGQADGSYIGNYTISEETTQVSNARVSLSFTDRADNEASNESDQRLTAIWLSAGDEQSFPLGNSGESIAMVWIPSGEYEMGSPNDEDDRDNDESPVHRVNINYGFWMGKYEVTQAQWEAVTGNNPSRYDGDNRPVEQVSWNDIHEDFLSQIDDDFRLPSESEWEYACRAGTETRFYWGDDPGYNNIGDYAVYASNEPGGTAVVGTKRPNAWGLYDMHGNVWEWCEDYYHDSYNGAPADGSAWNDNGSSRVLRGGSWYSNPRYCRSANRSRYYPDTRDLYSGFRLILVH